MQITDKILSIPPYLSTSWVNVSALYMEGHPDLQAPALVICLKDGQKIQLPEIDLELVEVIFENHARYLTRDKPKPGISILQLPAKFSLTSLMPDWLSNLPLRSLNDGEDLSLFMKHNPEVNGVIPIPDEVLKRVMVISRAILRPQDRESLPVPEENCRCPHCLIAGAIRKGFEHNEDWVDEPITDDDLKLGRWVIEFRGEGAYTVTSSLDPSQSYRVSLSQPVTCSCGTSHCEHIQVVLRS